MSDEFVPKRYACKGRYYHPTANELYVELDPIEADGTLGQGKLWGISKGTRWLRAGAVYEIPTNADGTTILAVNAKYQGQWEDKEAVVQWLLLTQAAEAEEAMARAHKKDPGGELLALLRPLREQYQKTIGTSRRLALEMALLHALRTPLKRGETRVD
jgi:plasmid replication initiation protein